MPKANSQKIIFSLLCFEGAVVSFNIASIAAVIQAIALDLNRDSFQIARIISFYMVPYGLAALFYAPLVKKYSVRLIKIVCLSVFSLASLAAGLSNSAGLLFSSRIIAGCSAASTTPVALILIGQLAQKKIRGRLVGAFFGATFVSSLIGVLLSGILPWRQLFILPALFALVNLALVIAFFNFKSDAAYDFEVNYLDISQDKRIVKIFAYILSLSLVYHGIYNWLGVYFSSLSFKQIQISLLLSLVGLSGIFGQLFGGWITDKKGRVFAASSGLILLSLAAFLLAKPFSFIFLALVLFIFGIGWTANHNAVSTVLTDFPDNLRPELASLNSAVRFVSGGLGVILAGVFMRKSFSLTFLGLGVIILALAIFTPKVLRIA